MYYVIESGGKQHRVCCGQKLKVEKLAQSPGEEVYLDKVLMLVDDQHIKYGSPYIAGEVVPARILQHGRNGKINIIKFKRRKHHLKRMNHRQNWTEIEILSVPGAKKKTESKAATEKSTLETVKKTVAKSKEVAAKKETKEKQNGA